MARSSPQEVRIGSPGKRSATGEMAEYLSAKHKNKRLGLPTEPFVYVGMTVAFPGGGAMRLSRATGCYAVCSPGKRSATGEIDAHTVKNPHLSVRGSSYLMPGSLWRASCPPPSGPLLRNVQIRSRRICPTPESAHRQTTNKTKGPVLRLSLSFYLMPGSSLLSHGETPHYHRRYGVSLLSSAWGQVGPPRYRRQANSVLPARHNDALINLYQAENHLKSAKTSSAL